MIIKVDESCRHKRDRTEQQLFAVVEQNTPDTIKTPLFPQDESEAFTFHLDKELIERLNLWEWFRNYVEGSAGLDRWHPRSTKYFVSVGHPLPN